MQFDENTHADLRSINALGMHRDMGGCDQCCCCIDIAFVHVAFNELHRALTALADECNGSQAGHISACAANVDAAHHDFTDHMVYHCGAAQALRSAGIVRD